MTRSPSRLLRTARGFLQLSPRAPELQLLHPLARHLDRAGFVVVGVERQGLRFLPSHLAEGEWRAYFMASPMLAPEGVRGGADAVASGASGGVDSSETG